ncbi:hypothetical protein [Anaerotignum sp.]|uniref:hypothetical protein n=1 Tax=Anaerotignum sp. TaxID=2039241 RepID=UPI0028AD8D34|nr:hypothetical protein [Anaerotignum sp.]
MNEKKKTIHLQGKVLTPLVIGNCAYIFHSSQVIRTSRIVSIGEVNDHYSCFETMNSYYHVEFSPIPINAAMPYYSQYAAA